MENPRFENLGDEQFQRFCQSLLTYEFPDLQALEVGQPDGGRDAFDRREFQKQESGSFFVFQVKYVRNSTTLKDPEKWVAGVLKDELPKIHRLAKRGATKYRLITNAGGSAHLDSGGVDKVNAFLAETLPIPADCWWRADLSVRVAKHSELRWGYPDLLTPADILKELIGNHLTEAAARRMAAIQTFLAAQHEADQYVKFKQVDLQNDLLSLFIDVPAALQSMRPRRSRQLLALIQSLDDNPQRSGRAPSAGAADLLFHRESGSVLPHVVVEGAPGQGKSTLAQYLCQIHRMRLLRKNGELRKVAERHRNGPARLPFKIDLRHFASFLQGHDPYEGEPEWGGLPQNVHRSLEGFLACAVTRYSGGVEFSHADLLAVLQESHVLLVLDGLDEVAEFRDRQAVVEAIKVAITRLESLAIGLQVVITSRPAAFTQSPGFSSTELPHLSLVAIPPPLALSYCKRWTIARRLSAAEGMDVQRVLEEQLDQPHIRDLARNPMQLAILLTLILTKGDSLPDERTDLYRSYLRIFFDREAVKAEVVRDHRPELYALHEYLAWKLHSSAEVDSSGGSISQEDLETEVRAYLDRQGLDVHLADKLFKGMVERVLALVSRIQGQFEFEVQPLREYFAASHLYSTAQVATGGEEKPGTILDRFDGLARNPYWLNVVRFYAGFYNSGQLPSLIFRLQALRDDPTWQLTDRPRTLAALFLADWSFALERQSREEAIKLALDAFGWRQTLGTRSFTGARLSLPMGAGRKEMLDRAWHLLALPGLPKDRRYALEIAVLTEPEPDRTDWIDRLPHVVGSERTDWIRLGARTGSLQQMQESEWPLLWADGETSEFASRAAELAIAGFAQKIEADQELVKPLVTDLIAGRALIYFDHDAPSWIGLLGSLLRPYGLYEYREVADLFRQATRMQIESRALAPAVESVRSVVLRLRETIEEEAAPPQLIQAMLELSREEWGDTWGLCRHGLALVGSQGRPSRPGTARNLFDGSTPLMQRLRYARFKGGRTAGVWWLGQGEAAHSVSEKMLWVTAGLSWASAEALVMILPKAGAILRGLEGHQFQEICFEMRRLGWGRRANRSLNLPNELMMEMPVRLAVALAHRDPRRFAERLYSQRLRFYGGRDIEVLRYCQEVAAEKMVSGKYSESSDLQLLRRAFKATGGHLDEFGLVQPPQAGEMPLEAAEEIVRNHRDYGLAIVQYAERRCYRHASQSLRPLRDVARRGRWFSTS
jgi:hypothetical protein